MTGSCTHWLLAVALGLTATVARGGQPAVAPKEETLSPKALEALWEELGGKDAAKAYRAIWTLANSPKQSAAFLKARLKPVVGPGPGMIERLIVDLDSKRFPEREKAMSELEKLGPLATPALEKALKRKPSLEMSRRIERLLERASGLTLSAEELRMRRALEAIEHMRTPEARALLDQLARGAPGAWPTEEAKNALRRLDRLKTVTP